MKLILVDANAKLCEQFYEKFEGLPNIEIIEGFFQDLPDFDCMVSAANSFGLMDGGVDGAIIRYFGPALMYRVQKRIIEEYRGEQPVGTSMLVETDNDQHPYIAHTPTMRIPMVIAHTDNPYRAMFAMLLAVHQHNLHNPRQIETIVCPGLGTGTGAVPFNQAAKQMALAYRNFLNPPTYIDWRFADQRHAEIRYGGDDGFRIPPDVDWK